MRYSNAFIVPSLLASVFLIGCSFDTPSHITPEKMRVIQTVDQDVYATNNLNNDVLSSIASSHLDNGGGQIDVTVSYDPSSSDNTKAKAENEAKRIQSYLTKIGVGHVTASVLPVNAPPAYSVTTLRYVQYDAEGPANCGYMPGYMDRTETGVTEAHKNYDYGCTVETLFAKQLADPSDLLGQDGFETKASGRQAENAISGSGYYAPGPSGALAGESSSGDN